MATWGQILGEIRNAVQAGDIRAFDNIRNKYVKNLSEYTGGKQCFTAFFMSCFLSLKRRLIAG